jgi:hypothetical protein
LQSGGVFAVAGGGEELTLGQVCSGVFHGVYPFFWGLAPSAPFYAAAGTDRPDRIAKTRRLCFFRLKVLLVKSAQKQGGGGEANCTENVTAQKFEGAKRAKTRENKRLTYAKLKKSKIFQKVLDKCTEVCYNKRRE